MNAGAAYEATSGTAGGATFGAAVRALANEEGFDLAALASAAGIDAGVLERVFAGEERLAPAPLARIAHALNLRAIAFMQRAGLLSLDVYAAGLDPLYFLPPGQTRYDARIYMREINPRHPVPERDMTNRNPVLKAVAEDTVLDPLGRLEIELAYLLRAAVQSTGGAL